MNAYSLAMLVLCIATLLQLCLQTVWWIHSARVFRLECAELARLRKLVAGKLISPHEAIELTRELTGLEMRVESIERQVGITRWRGPIEEQPPATKRTGN